MLISRIKPDGTTHYYHSDYRGNVIAMANSSGNITHKYSYDSYGIVLASEEADANPFQFVGIFGVMRENNNLSHMRARYYDASIGRFISEDPIWATNLFAYAQDNPLTFIDPAGKLPRNVKRGYKLIKFFFQYTSPTKIVFSAIVRQVKDDLNLSKKSLDEETVEHSQTLHDFFNWLSKTRLAKKQGWKPFNLSDPEWNE